MGPGDSLKCLELDLKNQMGVDSGGFLRKGRGVQKRVLISVRGQSGGEFACGCVGGWVGDGEQ